MNRLGRGLAALAVAVVVAVAGAGLAVGLAYANPGPTRVLSDARRFVARATSVRYTAALTTTLPAGANGVQVIRQSQLSGVAAFGRGYDYTSTAGASTTEVRVLSGRPGVLLRTGPAGGSLNGTTWHAVADLAQLDTDIAQAVARSTGAVYNPEAAGAVILSDELSTGDVVRRLMAAVGSPTRAGNDAHQVDATVDAATVFPGAPDVVGLVDVRLRVATDHAPRTMTVTARGATSSVTVMFRFANWNAPAEVPEPSAGDIAG